MMMMMTLSDLVAGPSDDPLGTLTTYSVPDRAVDAELFRKHFQAEGLDASLIPAAPQKVNIFQNAVRSVATKRGSKDAKGVRIAVDEVRHTSSECVYQVTHETIDRANALLDHPKAMKVCFDKTSSPVDPADAISVTPLDPQHYDALRHLEQAIRDYFTSHLDKLQGAKVREVLRTIFADAKATRWARNAAVFFVPISEFSTLEALKRVLEAIYGDDAEFDTIAVANAQGPRSTLERKHAFNVRSEAEAVMARVAERLKETGAVRKDMVAKVLEQRKALGDQRKAMAELLGAETDAVNSALSLLDDQIDALMDRTA